MLASRRRGFSLIEVLVAVGILALLLGLTLSAVQRIRESAKRAECQNRLRQQSLAVLNYESTTGRLPPGSIQGPFERLGVPDGVSHGMWPLVLPHLDEASLGASYRLDVAWDHPANRSVASARLPLLECPNAPIPRPDSPFGVADFAPVEVNAFLADMGLLDPASDFESALPVNGVTKLSDITDGTSQTLLLAEAGGRPGMPWASPEVLLGLRQVFGGLHRGGVNIGMADGSVRFLREAQGLRILGKLATRSGGESIDVDAY